MVVGGELFRQHVYLRTRSLKWEDMDLLTDGGMMTPYWSCFVKVCDDFGSRVAGCSG